MAGPVAILIPPPVVPAPGEPKPETPKPETPKVDRKPKSSAREFLRKLLADKNVRAEDVPAERGMLSPAKDAERDAAIRRLRAAGVPLTAVNIAEEIAVMTGETPPPAPVQGPGMFTQGGPSGASIEERIRAKQQSDEQLQRMLREQQQYVQPRR